jgi:hypothetical protein
MLDGRPLLEPRAVSLPDPGRMPKVFPKRLLHA